MMKKLLSGAIAVCLIGAALVGCGKGGETAASVIADLKEKGVPISYSIVYDDATDPNGEGPHDYKEKGNFADSRLETAYDESEPESGSVELYKSEAAAKARADKRNSFSVLDLLQYQIVKGNVLIRLNSAFTEEQVADYTDAIGGTLYHSPSASVHQSQYAYGKFFVEHAKQLKEGMTLAEATAIMGFAPRTSANTSIWFDEGSNSTVMVIVESGVVKTINAILEE